MKFVRVSSTLAAFAALASAASTGTVPVTYDQTYDQKGDSLNIVACSNGKNGLVGQFPTFGDIPNFPFIGGAAAVTGWNSTECGSCWSLTYNGETIYVTAIDFAGAGFNIALEAMNKLTDNNAVALGHVNAQAQQVDKSKCGFKA